MDAAQRLEPVLQAFVETVENLRRRVEESRPELKSVEEDLRRAVQEIGHAAMEFLVQGYGTGRTGNRHPCACGHQARFKDVSSKRLTDLYGGNLDLARAYYYCEACGQGVLPLDRELHLGEAEMTPALADVVELVGVMAPFDSAARIIEHTLGVKLSGERVRRRTERVGQFCLEADDREAQQACALGSSGIPEPPCGEHHYVMADGGMVPTREGYREAKVGICFRQSDHHYVEKGDERGVLVRKRFFGDIDTAESFGRRLYASVRKEGVAADGEGCQMLADGAPWIWNLKAEHLPKATETVDWYHAREHLSTTAHALYGEGTPQAAAWARARADELWSERHRDVLAALGRVRPRDDAARHSVTDLRRYLDTNRHRMRYRTRRDKGLLVGSGPIEGAIRYVVQDRLKRTGMHWSVAGARRVLALRLRWASDTWNLPGARPASASAVALADALP